MSSLGATTSLAAISEKIKNTNQFIELLGVVGKQGDATDDEAIKRKNEFNELMANITSKVKGINNVIKGLKNVKAASVTEEQLEEARSILQLF